MGGAAGRESWVTGWVGTCRRVFGGPPAGRPSPLPAAALADPPSPGDRIDNGRVRERGPPPSRSAARSPAAHPGRGPGCSRSPPPGPPGALPSAAGLRAAPGPAGRAAPLTSPGAAARAEAATQAKAGVSPAVAAGSARRSRAPAEPGPPPRSAAPVPRPPSRLPRQSADQRGGRRQPRRAGPAPPPPAGPAPPAAPRRRPGTGSGAAVRSRSSGRAWARCGTCARGAQLYFLDLTSVRALPSSRGNVPPFQPPGGEAHFPSAPCSAPGRLDWMRLRFSGQGVLLLPTRALITIPFRACHPVSKTPSSWWFFHWASGWFIIWQRHKHMQ